MIDTFLSLSEDDRFWAGLEQDSAWAVVLAMEPESPYRWIREEKLENVALAFADLKSFFTVGHSRRVGDLAEGIASRMRLPRDEVAAVRRAALIHDVGLVTVPSFVLQKPRETLTPRVRHSSRTQKRRSHRSCGGTGR